jgi:hypothetical protein
MFHSHSHPYKKVLIDTWTHKKFLYVVVVLFGLVGSELNLYDILKYISVRKLIFYVKHKKRTVSLLRKGSRESGIALNSLFWMLIVDYIPLYD